MANEEMRIRNTERVLQTAYELILQHGVENTTKEMLARASGMSRSTLDRYFPSKTDCIIQVTEWTAKNLAERMDPVWDMLKAGKATGAEILRRYLNERRAIFHDQRELFIAVAELRVYIARNCPDAKRIYVRMNALLGFKPLLCQLLAKGKADGSLLPSIIEEEEAIYINGFYREMLINIALARESSELEERMIDGFIDRMLRYYSNPSYTSTPHIVALPPDFCI